jgi:CBS domain-containing protein
MSGREAGPRAGCGSHGYRNFTDSTDEVRMVMTSPVVTTEPGATLRAAARVLRRNDVGAAVVLRTGELVGMLSERDLVQALADGHDPDVTRVSTAMTDPPRPIAADMPVWAAAIMMLRHHIRHLPVVDANDIVGMLSIRDALAVSQLDRIVRPRDLSPG